MTIKWENPPERKKPTGRTPKTESEKIADQLRHNPGAWARIYDDASFGVTTRIKQGKLRGFTPAGAFEAVQRQTPKNGKNRSAIWARYIGATTQENAE